MKLRSHIFKISILMAAMIAGCSDSHEFHSTAHHSSEHDIAQHAEPKSELKNDTDYIKPKINSASDSKPMTRSADTHSHGDAELAVVLEKSVVTIELDSPIYNILGFEHAPETEGQKTTLKQAEQQLGRGEALFTFNDQAKCTSLSKAMTVNLFETDTHEENQGHHEDENTHDEDTHEDVVLVYEFKCQNTAKLSNVTINLFEFFKELSEVDVTFLGPATQKQVTLNRNQRQLDIAP